MKSILQFAAILTVTLLVTFICQIPLIHAQEQHQHQRDDSVKIGQVNFQISCNAQAQKQFNQAVA